MDDGAMEDWDKLNESNEAFRDQYSHKSGYQKPDYGESDSDRGDGD